MGDIEAGAGYRTPPYRLPIGSATGSRSRPVPAWPAGLLISDTPLAGVFLLVSPWDGGKPLSTNDRERRVRVNRQIRISPVRVIADNGDQLGVLSIDEALALAEERSLDLVEVAPMARPPVVKIMDYGKYKFEEAKAARAAKKKQHVIQMKEVKYRPAIDDHDYNFKTKHAREFLQDGNKVKVTMMFRGRQMARPDLGRAVLDRVATDLADVGKIEFDAKLEGRNMIMVLAPK